MNEHAYSSWFPEDVAKGEITLEEGKAHPTGPLRLLSDPIIACGRISFAGGLCLCGLRRELD